MNIEDITEGIDIGVYDWDRFTWADEVGQLKIKPSSDSLKIGERVEKWYKLNVDNKPVGPKLLLAYSIESEANPSLQRKLTQRKISFRWSRSSGSDNLKQKIAVMHLTVKRATHRKQLISKKKKKNLGISFL